MQLGNATGNRRPGEEELAPGPAVGSTVAPAPMLALPAPQRRVSLPLWLKLLLTNPLAAAGCVILVIFVLAAIFAPLLTSSDPTSYSGARFLAPSSAHPFGTDYAGIDVFAEVVYGARVSLAIGAVTGLVTTALSIVVGMIAGYVGGWLDDALGVVMNIFLVIPQLPLLLVVSAYLPLTGPLAIILVISVTGWAWGARVLRSQTLSLRGHDFVQASSISGESTWRIVFREILPNMISLIASSFIFSVIGAIFAESALEFLGLGDPTTVSWGTTLYNAQQFSALQDGAWWDFAFPGLAIALTVTACVFVNYGIDAISNPRLRVVKVSRAYRKIAQAAASVEAGVAR